MAQARKWAQQWRVQGSAKEPYTVSCTADGSEWACNCRGWTGHFPRNDCKHIRGIKRDYPRTLRQLEREQDAISNRRFTLACPRADCTSRFETREALAQHAGLHARLDTQRREAERSQATVGFRCDDCGEVCKNIRLRVIHVCKEKPKLSIRSIRKGGL